MAESVETTLEEARRCPKCKEPGSEAGVAPAPGIGVTRGAKIFRYVCENNRCPWYGQVCKLVQVNPDGTIPPPTTTHRNSLRPLVDDGGRTRQRLLDQLSLETSGGGEIYS